MTGRKGRYRTLDVGLLVEGLEELARRITERFPDSGLSRVAGELRDVASESADRVETIRKPAFGLRFAMWALVVMMTGPLLYVAFDDGVRLPSDFVSFVGVLEAALGAIVFLGAAVIYLLSVETRIKRTRALEALHELRSLAHIVDLHQLTKDPERVCGIGSNTQSSPHRDLDPFELGRYLDYCSELEAMIGKTAALFAQSLPDPIVLAAVDEVEGLTTGLSRKIWQKIMLLESLEQREDCK